MSEVDEILGQLIAKAETSDVAGPYITIWANNLSVRGEMISSRMFAELIAATAGLPEHAMDHVDSGRHSIFLIDARYLDSAGEPLGQPHLTRIYVDSVTAYSVNQY